MIETEDGWSPCPRAPVRRDQPLRINLKKSTGIIRGVTCGFKRVHPVKTAKQQPANLLPRRGVRKRDQFIMQFA